MTRHRRWASAAVPSLAGFALGVTVCLNGLAPGRGLPGPTAPREFKRDDPEARGLDANLYMQTSAEYRACCLQAYNLATLRLKQAAGRLKQGDKKPAVVMDLDETVLDNAGFQAMQLRSGLAYDQRLWDAWEEWSADRVGLVPGAKGFIGEAEKLGVAVVYISNRNQRYRKQTKAALARLGVPAADDDCLKLATTTSDKTRRREQAEGAYAVLLYVGDNLRDFDDQFRCGDLGGQTPAELRKAVGQRNAKVDAQASAWGERWVILPNPAYGEWAKVLGRGRADYELLAPQAEERP